MVRFLRFFSERFCKKGEINAVEESKEREKTIEDMVAKSVLTKKGIEL